MRILSMLATWLLAAFLVVVPCFAADKDGSVASNRDAKNPRSAHGRKAHGFWEKPAMDVVKKKGWTENYKRGQEILHELSALGPKEKRKLPPTSYRDERVAFVGDAAPPGGTNDLVTDRGFYLRVVNKDGKDLRPHGITWIVVVCGKVWQVFPENKIIVIEVEEEDWEVLMTL